MYKDRYGNIIDRDATPNGALHFLYETAAGRTVLKFFTTSFVSNAVRAYMKSPVSALAIDSFVKKNGISLKEYVPTHYGSFNDFFTRRLKKGKRSFPSDPFILGAPCDSKVSAFRIDDDRLLNIKGSLYTVESLIRDGELADEFGDGWCVVLRLTVDDYHHYCYPDGGKKGANVFIPGVLHTVNPIATSKLKVYRENQREYTVIDSDHFGRFVQMEVGAMCVGRIVNLDGQGRIERGHEKGYFEFGGSTVILLFKKGYFRPDDDIVRNTEEGFETVVRMGERIGSNEKHKG